MKLLLIVYSGSRSNLVQDLLEEHEVGGYTEMEHAHGIGSTGRRAGTRAWPGESEVLFSAVPDERVDELLTALRAESDALEGDERLHVAVMPVELFF